jgi:hypothetical protein
MKAVSCGYLADEGRRWYQTTGIRFSGKILEASPLETGSPSSQVLTVQNRPNNPLNMQTNI